LAGGTKDGDADWWASVMAKKSALAAGAGKKDFSGDWGKIKKPTVALEKKGVATKGDKQGVEVPTQATTVVPIDTLHDHLGRPVKDTFDSEGFVVIPGFFSPAQVAEAIAHVTATVNVPGPQKNMQDRDPWFGEQMERGRPRSTVEALVGGPVQSASAGYFDKPLTEHALAAIAPHVDGLGKNDGATVWIALDRVTKDNGALWYVKGSHLVDHTPESIAAITEDSEGATCAEVNPGDAIVHTARTIHFSRKAQSPDPRRAINFFYWSSQNPERRALPYESSSL
jgi:hypothetical protein